MIERVLIAGGGTGGHLFPGLAVVDELRRRNPKIAIHFVGTERGIEARVLPARGESLSFLHVMPIKGRSLLQRIASIFALPMALLRALVLVKRFDPDVVIGVGGYASGPVMLAAALARYPTALIEQNAYVGLTNRILSRFIGRAYLSFEETVATFGKQRSCVSGNPLRPDIVSAARLAAQDPLGFEAKADSLLVIGGSQGSRALNEVLPHALALLKAEIGDLRIVHQAGGQLAQGLQETYQRLGIAAQVVPFIEDIGQAYAHARLVIARAGATTLAELCAIGRPALLVPFPKAADDHQTRNARALVARDAARMLSESDLKPERAAEEIGALLRDEQLRHRIAAHARSMGSLEATRIIVDDLANWLGKPADLNSSAARTGQAQIDPGKKLDSSNNSRQATSFETSRDSGTWTLPKREQKAQRRLLLVDGVRWD